MTPQPATETLAIAPILGLSAKDAAALERLGLRTLGDLWFHLPLRYEDRTRITPIGALQPGQTAQIEAEILAAETRFRGRRMFVAALGDASGHLTLRLIHFSAAQTKALKRGVRLRCYGDVRRGPHGLEMVHPRYRLLGPEPVPLAERLTPIYPTTEGLAAARLQRWIDRALERLPADAELELLAPALCARHGLGSLRAALLEVHRPPPGADAEALVQRRHPAQVRLAFEELLAHQLSLRRLRNATRALEAPVLRGPGRLAQQLKAQLGFRLTEAQERVLAEIAADLARPRPMLRLVQGDVGSGKTVVAALAALQAIECGLQVAVMAPTELLAEQHLEKFSAWFAPLGRRVQWLSGRVQGRARKQALAAAAGEADLVVGTHALMQEAVQFRALGLVIIDEQHRFGVHQRLALHEKGAHGRRRPHQLVMTATPIPRTLAMVSYADLDVSVIDRLPPGRSPITTAVVSAERRPDVIERIRRACGEGRQAYWVCTLIDENEKLEAKAAAAAYAELVRELDGLRIGLVHGRLKAAEKQAVMEAFRTGLLDVLVATTVIEVGVDVPNASLMVIENAERLGLAQLHQLRGRIGRGALASSCVLMYQPPLGPMARERLALMRETQDGFRIAERDLELRGPGELLGTRQIGQVEFRVADLSIHAPWIDAVRAVADQILATDERIADALIRRWIGAAVRYAHA